MWSLIYLFSTIALAKRYPPESDDEVWRLKKIRKDGPFHKRLQDANISKVKDILNLSATLEGKGELRVVNNNIAIKLSLFLFSLIYSVRMRTVNTHIFINYYNESLKINK